MNIEALVNHLSKNYKFSHYIYDRSKISGLKDIPHSVRLELGYNGTIFKTWGVDFNKDLAFFKALMELVERVSIHAQCPLYFRAKHFPYREESLIEISKRHRIDSSLLFPLNSNGAGVGPGMRKAKRAAQMELIERHTILSCILKKIPPLKISSPIFKYENLNFYYWKTQDYFVVLTIYALDSGGFIFSHACSSSASDAQNKAFLEIVPNIIFAISNKDTSPLNVSITNDNIESFGSYWQFSKDRRAFDFFESGRDDKNFSNIPKIKDFYFSSIPIHSIFSEINYPLKCYRAISPQAQQLFFDNWDLKYINQAIGEIDDLPPFPHIIA